MYDYNRISRLKEDHRRHVFEKEQKDIIKTAFAKEFSSFDSDKISSYWLWDGVSFEEKPKIWQPREWERTNNPDKWKLKIPDLSARIEVKFCPLATCPKCQRLRCAKKVFKREFYTISEDRKYREYANIIDKNRHRQFHYETMCRSCYKKTLPLSRAVALLYGTSFLTRQLSRVINEQRKNQVTGAV